MNTKPIVLVRMSGITAILFGLGLVLGGVAFGYPSAYQLVSGKPLPTDSQVWMSAIGLLLIGVGMISAAVSGILRTAKAAGDEIYARHQALDQENKKQ